jgi:curved DNA-binding protein
MEYKDYYKLLDVDRKAGDDEIKRAYRKLAMKYHPDRNPNDPKAEDKFKEINEAYQVLSDPTKRSRYDQLGDSYTSWQQGGAPPGGFNWSDWYTTSSGSNVDMGNLDDILGGGFSEFFRTIFGGMRTPPTGRSTGQRRPRVEMPSYRQELTISLTEAYLGTTRRLEIDGRRMEVKIPPGARTGTKVRVAEAVAVSDNPKKADLYLVIEVADDPRFERKGNNLHTEATIDLYTAVLGGEITVPTLAGNVRLTIPPGTQPGQAIRLAGRGMPLLKTPQDHGDLYVRTRVKIPRDLTPRQKELFQELARS